MSKVLMPSGVEHIAFESGLLMRSKPNVLMPSGVEHTTANAKGCSTAHVESSDAFGR